MPRGSAEPAPLVPLPARLGILLSGRGSNFEALADACDAGRLPARVALVLSDRADAAGLASAARRGIPARAVLRADFPSKSAFEAALGDALEAAEVDLICLAGFMRILSPAFVERFPMRILNVHPSLLPAFPGKDAVGQAIRAGVKVSGATIHFVDAGMDTGPVVAQEAVPVEAEDDAEALAARVLRVEHRLYADSAARILAGGWCVDGRIVRFPAARRGASAALPRGKSEKGGI